MQAALYYVLTVSCPWPGPWAPSWWRHKPASQGVPRYMLRCYREPVLEVEVGDPKDILECVRMQPPQLFNRLCARTTNK